METPKRSVLRDANRTFNRFMSIFAPVALVWALVRLLE